MNAIGAIVPAIFWQMRRDRSAVVFLVLLPIGLMVLMGNIYEAEDSPIPRLAVLVERPDTSTAALVELLEDGNRVEIDLVSDRGTLDDAVRRRRAHAGLVLAAGRPAELVGAPDAELPGGVRFVVQGAVSRVERAVMLADALPETELSEILDTMPEPAVAPVDDPAEARTEAAIGVLVLVTFMNLIAYGSMVPSHRSVGVIERLGAAPVRRGALLGGYGVAFLAVAVVQVGVALLAGTFLVGISWGPILGLGLMGLGLAFAAAGVGVLAATLLPTPESGSSLGGPVGFAFGMLGGCLWPLEFVGGVLESIGRWIPHNWAVTSFRDIADGAPDPWSLATSFGALVLVGLAACLLGSRRLRSTWA